jgi:hypothetical protein
MGIAQVGMVVAGEQAVNRQLRESLQGLDIRRFVKVLSTLPTQGRIRENNIAYEPDNLSKVSELVYYRPVGMTGGVKDFETKSASFDHIAVVNHAIDLAGWQLKPGRVRGGARVGQLYAFRVTGACYNLCAPAAQSGRSANVIIVTVGQ